MNVIFTIFAFVTLFFSFCNDRDTEERGAESVPLIPVINFSVTRDFPHDTSSFTEGLLVHNGQIVESTGSPDYLQHAKSIIGTLDLTTGKIAPKVELDKTKYFGEGIVILNNKVYQLTYKNKMGFIYDAKSFRKIGKFNYLNEEGWGLTTNGHDIIMSDGTDRLYFLNPRDLSRTKFIEVSENGVKLTSINELEYIKGYIYANIFETNNIVKINPDNGKVVGKLDLTSLHFEAKNINPNSDVLNGIAYDSTSDKIYVTGKLWPKVYQLNFLH